MRNMTVIEVIRKQALAMLDLLHLASDYLSVPIPATASLGHRIADRSGAYCLNLLRIATLLVYYSFLDAR